MFLNTKNKKIEKMKEKYQKIMQKTRLITIVKWSLGILKSVQLTYNKRNTKENYGTPLDLSPQENTTKLEIS